MAGREGLEPTTLELTALCSTAELTPHSWRRLSDSNARRAANPLSVFKTEPLSRLGKPPLGDPGGTRTLKFHLERVMTLTSLSTGPFWCCTFFIALSSHACAIWPRQRSRESRAVPSAWTYGAKSTLPRFLSRHAVRDSRIRRLSVLLYSSLLSDDLFGYRIHIHIIQPFLSVVNTFLAESRGLEPRSVLPRVASNDVSYH